MNFQVIQKGKEM